MSIIDTLKGYAIKGIGGEQGKYWYVHGKNRDGKVVFLGKFENEDEAESQLARLRSGRTFCFPTDNYQKAKAMAYKQLLKDDDADDGAMRNQLSDANDYVGRQKREHVDTGPERY